MAAYIARRIGQALLVIWLAYTLVFLAVQLLPNDPVTIFLSADAATDPATIAAMKAQYGYDQPLLVQYTSQLAGLFRGDFGYSLASGQPVAERIGAVVGSTLLLATSAFGTAVVFAGLTVVIAVAALSAVVTGAAGSGVAVLLDTLRLLALRLRVGALRRRRR